MRTTKFIDSHCHLDLIKKMSIAEVIRLSLENSVEKIITIASNPNNLLKVLEISQKHKEVYCSQGIHPHDANQFNDQILEKIEKNIKFKKCVAIGEIGLDYHYNFSPKDLQIKAFVKQLELACKVDLPVIIHSREADEDMLEILQDISSKLNRKGVLHSYSSGEELALWGVQAGFYFGFNGMVTFKKAQNVRDVISKIPIERILLETDAPFLAPSPHRGKENGPQFIPLIATEVARIFGISSEVLADQVHKNFLKLFLI